MDGELPIGNSKNQAAIFIDWQKIFEWYLIDSLFGFCKNKLKNVMCSLTTGGTPIGPSIRSEISDFSLERILVEMKLEIVKILSQTDSSVLTFRATCKRAKIVLDEQFYKIRTNKEYQIAEATNAFKSALCNPQTTIQEIEGFIRQGVEIKSVLTFYNHETQNLMLFMISNQISNPQLAKFLLGKMNNQA